MLAVDFTNSNASDNISLTLTPVALSGPLFFTIIIHFTLSLYNGFSLSTIFVISKSAAGGTSTDASSWLLDLLWSYSFPKTSASLVNKPVLLINVVISNVFDENASKFPIYHFPLV